MHRAKWIRIAANKSLKEIVFLLSHTPYDTTKHSGFEILERSQSHLECRYVERLTSLEEIRDPFGVVTTVESTRYQAIAFRFFTVSDDSASNLLLQVMFPPRSLRSLIDRLDELLSGVTISDIDISPISVFKAIKQGSKRSFISKIRASNVWLSEHSCARLEIVSSNDALGEFQTRFGKNESPIEKIRIELPFESAEGFLEISKSGSVMNDEESEEMTCHFLLDYLRESV